MEQQLGEQYEVFSPRMPCQDNARYADWKLWFAKILPLLEKNAILMGPSLGGIFLAKYLSEETIPKKILATFLIAAPYDKKDIKEALGDFVLPEALEKLEAQAGKVFLYHSKDDPIVPFVNLQKYQKTLPEAHVRIFEDRGHFNVEEFPEIVEDIKTVVEF